MQYVCIHKQSLVCTQFIEMRNWIFSQTFLFLGALAMLKKQQVLPISIYIIMVWISWCEIYVFRTQSFLYLWWEVWKRREKAVPRGVGDSKRALCCFSFASPTEICKSCNAFSLSLSLSLWQSGVVHRLHRFQDNHLNIFFFSFYFRFSVYSYFFLPDWARKTLWWTITY